MSEPRFLLRQFGKSCLNRTKADDDNFFEALSSNLDITTDTLQILVYAKSHKHKLELEEYQAFVIYSKPLTQVMIHPNQVKEIYEDNSKAKEVLSKIDFKYLSKEEAPELFVNLPRY